MKTKTMSKLKICYSGQTCRCLNEGLYVCERGVCIVIPYVGPKCRCDEMCMDILRVDSTPRKSVQVNNKCNKEKCVCG